MPDSPNIEEPSMPVTAPGNSQNESTYHGDAHRRLACQCFGVFMVGIESDAENGASSQPITAFRSDRTKCLLAYLIVEANQAHSRNGLASLLWPDEVDATARHNLRQALYQLNQILGSGIAQSHLRVTRDTVMLLRDRQTRYDVGEFQTAIDTGQLSQALTLYRGDFLGDLALSAPSERYAEWLSHHRTLLHRQACDALVRLTQHALDERASITALTYAERHLALDPLSDVAHRHVIQAHLLAGNLAAAVAHYRAYETQLTAELGISPSADLRALLPERLPTLSGPTRPVSPANRSKPANQIQSPAKTTARAKGKRAGTAGAAGAAPQLNLLEMPPPHAIYGRTGDLAQLQAWLSDAQCRLIAITGLGGIGKTTLTANLVRDIANQYEVVIWRSLANAPQLTSVMQDWLSQIAPESSAATAMDADVLWRELLTALQHKRCLLILDNVESVFEGGSDRHGYRTGYSDYGVLFQRLAESAHRSQMLLTSRELPYEIVRVAAAGPQARVRQLKGLDMAAVQQLLSAQHLAATPAACESMAEVYSGNPLAIKLVSHVIQMLYSGDAEAYLHDADRPGVIDDVRRLIDSQFERLSPLERQVFFWLVVARTPVSLDGLWADLWPPVPKRILIDALLSLERRSLLERDERSSLLYLPNVVLEYGSDHFVERAAQATLDGTFDGHRPSLLFTHAWIKAHAPDYIRESQTRLILQPIAQLLLARLGRNGLDTWVRTRLDTLRQDRMAAQSYAAGNFVNLLVCAEIDLYQLDCSQVSVRQAYLPDSSLGHVSFAGATLSHCVFRQEFTLVKSLAFDPAGQRLAMGTAHGDIRMWNLQHNQLDWSTRVYSAFVWGLAFSADGHRLVTGGNDGGVHLMDADTGTMIRHLHTHTGEVRGVALSMDGNAIYTACTRGLVRATDAQGNVQWETQHTYRIEGLALSPDDRVLATSGDGHAIHLWDAGSGQLIQTLNGHSERVKGLAFSPDGRYLASASNDYSVRLWDMASGETVYSFTGHTAWVWGVRFSPDGQLLASSGDDQTIRIWQINSGECVRVIRGHNHWVRPVDFHPTQPCLASASDDQTVRLWNLQTGKSEWTQRGYTNWIRALRFHPKTQHLAVGTADHRVRVWDVPRQQVIAQLNGHRNVVSAVAYSGDGNILVSGSVDNSAQVWQLKSLHQKTLAPQVLAGHTAQLYGVASSADGLTIATASADHSVMLWHPQSEQAFGTLQHDGKVYAIDLTGTGETLVAGTSAASIYVWDVRTQQLHARWQAHDVGVYAIVISQDGRLIASGGTDHLIHLWDAQTGQRLKTFEGHSETIFSLAFGPDGQLLVSGSYDRSVRLWDVATGKLFRILEHDAGFLRAVAFSADGKWVASGGADEWVRVWQAPDFDLVFRFKPELPYTDLNLANSSGLTAAQRQALKALGAVD